MRTTAPTTPALSATEKFAAYLPHIHRRWLAQQEAWQRRREAAWAAARRAATILYTQFAVQQVIAFGSLVQPGRFNDWSDIDLAVSGLSSAVFFKAWGRAGADCPFELDLVDLADCSPALREVILREGVLL